MEGVRQGCMLCLIVLCITYVKGENLEISVPHKLDVYAGKEAIFAVVYAPNTTKDEVQIRIAKFNINIASPVVNISVSNDSQPVIYLANGWKSKISVKHRYNKFFVTLKNVQPSYNGNYDVTVEVNGETQQQRMVLHVLEKPTSVKIEILNTDVGPFSENTLVDFLCTGKGGKGVGEITLARKTAGDVSFFPLKADPVNITSNEFTRDFNYTFQRTVDRQDNGSQYVCDVYEGPYFLESGRLLRSEPVGVTVDFNGVDLRANPSTITIGGQNTENSRLTISCTPNVPGITVLFTIEIGKKTQLNTNSPIVQILSGSSNVEILDPSLQQRMTQTGSINGGSGNLEIVLSDLRCTDAASYYCTSLYTAGGSGKDEDIVNVTARTFPEEVTMFPSPDNIQYDPDTQLELTCNGRIGNQFDQNNMANVWVWEWRFVDGFNSQWTTYPNTNNNITFEPPTTAANCQYNARSVLKHVVKSTDNGRQFRCYVVSPEYGGNKTVYTEKQPVTQDPNTAPNTGPDEANLGMILGIVFGVLAVIVIVVVLVYFLVFRRKSGGDDYDTGEGKEGRPPMTDNVVYSTPASREPNRMKGRENNAMDEPHEKNPRPYLPKDYDNRGHNNPAMDDDDSRHDRSYDDDNTDSRMRAPYGSAV